MRTGISDTRLFTLTEDAPTASARLNVAGNTFYRIFGDSASDAIPDGGTLTDFSLQFTSTASGRRVSSMTGAAAFQFEIFGTGGVTDVTLSSPGGQTGTATVVAQSASVYADADELVLTADELSEWIRAEGGDDYVVASAGYDIYEGGSGFDVLDYSDSAAAITLNLTADLTLFSRFGALSGEQLYSTGGLADAHLVYGFEHFIGSAHDDTFNGSTRDEVFEGGGGADVFNGGRGQ